MGTSPAQGKPSAMAQQPLCRVCWLGQDVEYQAAWDLQRRLAAERAAGTCADTLLLLEHAPVYTAGRRAPPEHVLLDADGLRRLGVPLIETDRGGQVAYHGPGQLVGYPILELRDHGMGPRQYVRLLERVLVETLAAFDIHAHTEEGLTGVWVYTEKVAAIGVKLSRGVTLHGFSLNVDPDLDYYRHIVACGITSREVTSMARLLKHDVPMDAVRRALVRHFAECCGVSTQYLVPSDL